jgi:hypothetical protein
MNKKRHTNVKKQIRLSIDLVILSSILFLIYMGLNNITLIVEDREVFLNQEIRVGQLEEMVKTLVEEKEAITCESTSVE